MEYLKKDLLFFFLYMNYYIPRDVVINILLVAWARVGEHCNKRGKLGNKASD